MRKIKDMPYHLSRGIHDRMAGMRRAGECRRLPGPPGSSLVCPVRNRRYAKMAEIILSENETEYYCPMCDALVMVKKYGKETIIDSDHMPRIMR